jgi:acetyl-CoA carboxylase carboxyltransferase component
MLGPQFAGSSYSPILKDFLIMRKSDSVFMALASPPVIKEVTGAEVTYQEIGGAMLHAEISGICDLVVDEDEEAIAHCRKMLGFFPSNWMEKPPVVETRDDPNRKDEELLDLVPFDLSAGYDMKDVILRLVDDRDFFEIKPLFAGNVIIGFARLNGQSVGIVANNPLVKMGAIDHNSSDKAARFIRFCDAFNIPLVFLEDTVGFVPDAEQERLGLARHAAKVAYAICEATVPKITVYVRNCSGYGELAMGTGQMGIDMTLAWPNAQIGRVNPEEAVNSIYAQEIAEAEKPEEIRQKRTKEIIAKFDNVVQAGVRQLVDDIIDPRDTRPVLINALDWFTNKTENRPWKKHGNIPF